MRQSSGRILRAQIDVFKTVYMFEHTDFYQNSPVLSAVTNEYSELFYVPLVSKHAATAWWKEMAWEQWQLENGLVVQYTVCQLCCNLTVIPQQHVKDTSTKNIKISV